MSGDVRAGSSRRDEDDYTAFEREERFGRFHDVDAATFAAMLHPSFPRTPCPECGSTAHGDCGDMPSLRDITAARLRGTRWSG